MIDWRIESPFRSSCDASGLFRSITWMGIPAGFWKWLRRYSSCFDVNRNDGARQILSFMSTLSLQTNHEVNLSKNAPRIFDDFFAAHGRIRIFRSDFCDFPVSVGYNNQHPITWLSKKYNYWRNTWSAEKLTCGLEIPSESSPEVKLFRLDWL